MPRPNPAQLAYGSATVICSTLAMLLLSQTHSGPGIVVIALAAMALGLLVALTAPSARTTRKRQQAVAETEAATTTRKTPVSAQYAASSSPTRVSAGARVPETTLRS